MLTTVQTADPQTNGKCRFQRTHVATVRATVPFSPPSDPPADHGYAAVPAPAGAAERSPQELGQSPDKPAFSNARARIAEIERLWMQGYTTYQIAEQIGEPPRDVGRNLREIRKRMQRAAQRESHPAVVAARCAEMGREAMEAWRRSQGTHQVVTTRQKDGCPDTVTTRTEEKPGNAAFLNAALRAAKTLGNLASQLPTTSTKSADAARLALAEVLTSEQSSILSPKQQKDFAIAFERWKELFAIVNAASSIDAEAPASVIGDENRQPPEASTAARDELQSEQAPAVDEAEMPSETTAEPVESADSVTAAPESPANSDEPAPSLDNGAPLTVRRPAAIRHPEWPAESFLTRVWLPPDRRMALDEWENAACGVDFPALESRPGTDRAPEPQVVLVGGNAG